MQGATEPRRMWLDSAAYAKGASASARRQPPPSVALEMGLQGNGGAASKAKKLVKENSLIVLSSKGCCMSHVLKLLLQGLGVNPTVHEVDDDDEPEVLKALATLDRFDGAAFASSPQLPTVFVGGKLLGGLDKVMTKHISGELVPILKDVGALWL